MDAIQQIRRHEKNRGQNIRFCCFWATSAASTNGAVLCTRSALPKLTPNAHANHIIFDLNVKYVLIFYKYLGGLFKYYKMY